MAMDSTTTYSREGTSLFGLVAGLREDFRTLFHEEVQLAKAEISEKVALLGRNSIYLAIGGAIAFVATIFLLLSLGFIISFGFESLGLSTGVALFLGFLAVAVVCGAVGGIMVGKALSAFSHQSLIPEKTLHTLREIKEGGVEQIPIKTSSAKAVAPKDTRSSDQIRSDVEQTRSRIGREVRALKTRMSAAQLAGAAVGLVKKNPVRSVGIGLGTGLVGFVLMRITRLLERKRTA